MIKTLTAPTLAIAVALSAFTAPVLADKDRPMRTMTMTGHGTVSAAPDMATVTIGVLREAKTAREALLANNQAMADVLKTLKAADIAEKDIQTSGFSVQPKYVYPKRSNTGEQEPPRIVGYTVSNNVAVAVRKLESLGPVLDNVIGAGSNQIHGVSFSIAEPDPLRNQARKLATADALAKASLYAEAAGVGLVDIQSISEHSTVTPPQPMLAQARAMAMEAASPVPIAQGEQSIDVQVHIVWEIR
jgi:uncharacterized protein YggE